MSAVLKILQVSINENLDVMHHLPKPGLLIDPDDNNIILCSHDAIVRFFNVAKLLLSSLDIGHVALVTIITGSEVIFFIYNRFDQKFGH